MIRDSGFGIRDSNPESRIRSAPRRNHADEEALLIARVSALENADGDGIPRQMASTRKHAKRLGFERTMEIEHKGVTGTKPLQDRPGVRDAVAAGCKHIISEDVSRVARKMDAFVDARRWAHKSSVTVSVAGHDDLLATEDPTQKFNAYFKVTSSEFDRDMTAGRLRAARDAKRRTTSERTVENVPKVEGRKAWQALYRTLDSDLADLLARPFLKRVGVDGRVRTLGEISAYLKDKGVVTSGKHVAHSSDAKTRGERIDTKHLRKYMVALDAAAVALCE